MCAGNWLVFTNRERWVGFCGHKKVPGRNGHSGMWSWHGGDLGEHNGVRGGAEVGLKLDAQKRGRVGGLRRGWAAWAEAGVVVR